MKELDDWMNQKNRKELAKMEGAIQYDRKVLVEILVYHYRMNISGCGCGWAELGKSHPEHVADVYEASVLARRSDGVS